MRVDGMADLPVTFGKVMQRFALLNLDGVHESGPQKREFSGIID